MATSSSGKTLVDTGARIRIAELSPTEAQIWIDETSVELTFDDLERLAKTIKDALDRKNAVDPR